jgi:hypothetical protein
VACITLNTEFIIDLPSSSVASGECISTAVPECVNIVAFPPAVSCVIKAGVFLWNERIIYQNI